MTWFGMIVSVTFPPSIGCTYPHPNVFVPMLVSVPSDPEPGVTDVPRDEPVTAPTHSTLVPVQWSRFPPNRVMITYVFVLVLTD